MLFLFQKNNENWKIRKKAIQILFQRKILKIVFPLWLNQSSQRTFLIFDDFIILMLLMLNLHSCEIVPLPGNNQVNIVSHSTFPVKVVGRLLPVGPNVACCLFLCSPWNNTFYRWIFASVWWQCILMLTPIKQNVIPIRISVFLLKLYYKNCTQLLVYFKFVKNFVEIWFLFIIQIPI